MKTVRLRSYEVIDLYTGSPQSVVPEVLNAAMPLSVKLRGYPTENENPRGEAAWGCAVSAWSRSFNTGLAL